MTNEPTRSAPAYPPSFVFLLVVFFFSGLSGLVYQVVWSRMMTLVFGSTTYAVSTVLGVFMFGLALGSYLAGRYIHRITNQLRGYALLEIGIGGYAAAFLAILAAVQSVHAAGFPLVFESPALLNLFRLALSFAILILPTTMMGATLPLLSQYVTRSPRHVGQDVGALYFVNTMGATAGTFLAAFALIPNLGLHVTIWLAAGLNILLGLIVLAAAGREETLRAAAEERMRAYLCEEDAARDCTEKETQPGARVSAAGVAPDVTPLMGKLVVLSFALTGFMALIFEVAWTRALILVFGSSVYSFATMLTTFLFGLAVGSMVVSRLIDRIKNPIGLFCSLAALMGFSVICTTPVIGMLPDLMVRAYDPGQTSWLGIIAVQFGMCFLVMLPATLASGGLFPIASRIVLYARAGQVGRTVGDVYAYNTVGGILGSLATGFILIPSIGIETSLYLGGAACALTGALVYALCGKNGFLQTAAPVTALVLVVALPFAFPGWNQRVMNMGVYRNTEKLAQGMEQGQITSLRQIETGLTSLFYKEGPAATVEVTRDPTGVLNMHINGKIDGSSGLDSFTQILSGVIPVLYDRAPEDQAEGRTGLVVGLATGMTVGSLLAFPHEHVECVEISPAVVEASHLFDQVNLNPLAKENMDLRVLDGRTWLMAMPEMYDVIVCEPSNPWQTGNANLFTRDFYELAAKRLKAKGVFCQWLPIYDVDIEHYKILLATFKRTFPYVHLWMFMSDTILIGSQEPLTMDPAELTRVLTSPAAAQTLARLGVDSPQKLLSFFYLDAEAVNTFVGDVEGRNTDVFPVIEFNSPKYVHRPLSQDAILFPLAKLAQTSNLPVGEAADTPELRAAIRGARIALYSQLGVPLEVLTTLFPAVQ